MSIHQQVNYKTIDPANLPDQPTANEVMLRVSMLLWNLDNRESYTKFHDNWTNSTKIRGIRTHRVRHTDSPEVQAVLPKIHEMLAPFDGQYKIYTWGTYFVKGDIGYTKYTGHALCVVLYYKSQPRKKYEYTS